MRSSRLTVLLVASGVILALGLAALAGTLAVGSSRAPQGAVQNRAQAGDLSCDGSAPGTANPAAVYCRELGYQYQRVDTDQGQGGICFFPDGSQCDEWGFLEGKCGQSYSYCARQGYGLITKTDGRDPFSRDYSVCVRGQEEIGPVTELMRLSELASRGASRVEQGPSPPEEAPSVATLPSSFDWRSYNGQDWMTSVKNQGGCGSCWAFSAVGAVEAVYNIGWNNPNLDLDLSEQYLVSDCLEGNTCCGGWHYAALDFIRDSGIPDEACLLYVDGAGCWCGDTCSSDCTYHSGDSCSDKTCSDRCSDWASRLRKIRALGSVSPSQFKQKLIDKGPLSVLMGILGQYGGYWDGDIYRCTNDSGINHAVVILGYDDAGGYWIVKNSWGTWFGENGYFKVGYGECSIESSVYYATPPCPPVMPGTYAGSVALDGALAPNGTTITVSIGGLQWGSTTTSGGNYALDIPRTAPQEPPCFEGGPIVFEADGVACTPSPDWAPGLHSDVDLVCWSAACITYASSDVPKPIPDVATVVSTVNVGDAFALIDVNAGPLSITHTRDADLDVFLVSPQGTRVELFTDVGGRADNFTATVLDDECATPITSGRAPFTGCYRPEGSLSAFDGENPSGVWTLEVTDDLAGNTGTLQAWRLELCGAWEQADSDGDGWSNGEERDIGTDPLDDCPDDGSDAAWPPDISNDTKVNIRDVVKFRPVIFSCSGDASYNKRYDLTINGCINIADVVKLRPYFWTQCTNP